MNFWSPYFSAFPLTALGLPQIHERQLPFTERTLARMREMHASQLPEGCLPHCTIYTSAERPTNVQP